MKLRIKNFRSLKDTGYIEIKPITLFVGKNSSGKSSFLRTFPMLKQSTEEKTKSPILLYGNYVDFGSYRDIKPYYSKDSDDKYELSFAIGNDIFENMIPRFRGPGYTRKLVGRRFSDIIYSLKFEENEKGLIHISEIYCLIYKRKLIIKLDHKKQSVTSLTVDGKSVFKEDSLRFIATGDFLVELFSNKKSDIIEPENVRNLILKRILALLGAFCKAGTTDEAKWGIVENVSLHNSKRLLTQLQETSHLRSWTNRIKDWDITTVEFRQLKELLILYDFFSYYSNAISRYLNTVFATSKYIAPLRATAERYYRIQHLAVDEVDPNGKNLPIFLDSLTEGQMIDFQEWTSNYFNFKTKISKIEGHYSIKIVQENQYETNLSDMGFGYSQILPILTQLWYTSSRSEKRRPFFLFDTKYLPKAIVIEQPELHLHPEFQAKFADAIAKVINSAKEKEINLKLIIETHSDIIVNRLGDCILDNDISSSDINIVIFNKESEHNPTNITTAQYDEEGNLRDWPLGFFLPTIK